MTLTQGILGFLFEVAAILFFERLESRPELAAQFPTFLKSFATFWASGLFLQLPLFSSSFFFLFFQRRGMPGASRHQKGERPIS